MTDEKPKQRRGFAAMSPEKQREISSLGGKGVPAHKRAFSTDRKLASDSGRKGGSNTPASSRTFAVDPVKASEAGRKGGIATHHGKTPKPPKQPNPIIVELPKKPKKPVIAAPRKPALIPYVGKAR